MRKAVKDRMAVTWALVVQDDCQLLCAFWVNFDGQLVDVTAVVVVAKRAILEHSCPKALPVDSNHC